MRSTRWLCVRLREKGGKQHEMPKSGGTLGNAAAMANHASTRAPTAVRPDGDDISVDEVQQRIRA